MPSEKHITHVLARNIAYCHEAALPSGGVPALSRQRPALRMLVALLSHAWSIVASYLTRPLAGH